MNLDVKVEAEMLKNVELHSVAIALASIVFPFPGGPKNRIPFAGDKSPLKISGLKVGKIIVSLINLFTFSRPLISENLTFGLLSKIDSSITYKISLSMFNCLNEGSLFF